MIYVRCKNHPPTDSRPTDKVEWVDQTRCVVCIARAITKVAGGNA